MEHLKNWTNFIEKYQNVLIKNEHDVYYLTKFHSTNMFILIIEGEKFVLTDQRYLEQARKKIPEFVLIDLGNKTQFQNVFKKLSGKTLYVSEDDFTIHAFKFFNSFFKKNKLNISVKAIGFPPFRIIKSKEEIADTKKAIAITDDIFKEIINWIKPGLTELDVYKKIMILTIESVANGESFLPIVAAGINGANPHWHSSNYVIKDSDMITIDMGVFYKQGCSDMTRTIMTGTPNCKQKQIFDLVNKSMELAIAQIKPGVTLENIDKVARDFLKENGYGDDYFTHALGHGIGVDIHEPPTVSPNSKGIIEEGMIFTIEPGIYIPKELGCRLEQDILVTKKGHKVLNKSKVNLEIKDNC